MCRNSYAEALASLLKRKRYSFFKKKWRHLSFSICSNAKTKRNAQNKCGYTHCHGSPLFIFACLIFGRQCSLGEYCKVCIVCTNLDKKHRSYEKRGCVSTDMDGQPKVKQKQIVLLFQCNMANENNSFSPSAHTCTKLLSWSQPSCLSYWKKNEDNIYP